MDINLTQGALSSGIQNVKIDNGVHNHYPHVYKHLIKTHIGSITFNPNQLRLVVETIAKNYDEIEQYPKDFSGISIESKNSINNLSQSFYDQIIARDYEPYFNELDIFFRERTSDDLQLMIGKIAKSLNKQIQADTDSFRSFELLLTSVESALLDDQFVYLEDKEDSIALFLYYLYANCFIGRKTKEELTC